MEVRDNLLARQILETIAKEVPEAYVVGGAVRDRLMGQPLRMDLDLAVPCDGFKLAQKVVREIGSKASFVPLDSDWGTGRVVLRGEPLAVLDISTFKGHNIHEDLRHRDFTINALAMTIPDFLAGADDRVVDPTRGSRDLRNKTIRACSKTTFEEDPLRILRAFRFKACLNFSISTDTIAMIPGSLARLAGASPERIRDELIAALSAPSTFPALSEMDSAGIIDLLFPEILPMKGCIQNEFHHLDVWGHTLEAVKLLEYVLSNPGEYFDDLSEIVSQYCLEEPVKGRPRSALLKLATIFHDSGKPHAVSINSHGRIHFFGHEKISRQLFEKVGLRLRLAGREIKSVSGLVGGHMRTLIFTREPVTSRAIYRLCRHFKRDFVGLFALFFADLGASRGPARPEGVSSWTVGNVRDALRMCLEADRERQPPLLNGREVMDLFGLQPGPFLGRVLKKLDELQGEGEIKTREEAVEAARTLLKEKNQSQRTRKPRGE